VNTRALTTIALGSMMFSTLACLCVIWPKTVPDPSPGDGLGREQPIILLCALSTIVAIAILVMLVRRRLHRMGIVLLGVHALLIGLCLIRYSGLRSRAPIQIWEIHAQPAQPV